MKTQHRLIDFDKKVKKGEPSYGFVVFKAPSSINAPLEYLPLPSELKRRFRYKKDARDYAFKVVPRLNKRLKTIKYGTIHLHA